tara:strand:- start:3417 stop:3587 length:171 start_codon:yes stop_codon:yes gene_type:complete
MTLNNYTAIFHSNRKLRIKANSLRGANIIAKREANKLSKKYPKQSYYPIVVVKGNK